MDQVTVIAAQGGTVRGPASVKLTKEQHARRIASLGPKYPRGGVFDLDGGQAVQFKLGEQFGLDAEGRLHCDIFAVDEPNASKAASGKGDDPDDVAVAAGDEGAGE